MRLLGNRFLVHSPGSFLSEWSSVCRSRVFLAARGFCPLTPHDFSLACLLALALAGSLACLSLACLVACLLGQASISLPMVCAGLRSFGAGLSAPLLKCALAPQREPCRMRALICPRSGRSHKRCAPSGSRSGAARVCPEIKNSSNTNQSKTKRCESARKWS